MTCNGLPASYFPFDGTCDCSRDWDFTLEFDDDASLKTHTTLLKLASPIFASMLTDCTRAKALCLEETSQKAWIVILNHIHPSAPPFSSGFDIIQKIDLLVRRFLLRQMRTKMDLWSQADVLEQARKFQMDFLLVAIDEAILSKLPTEAHINKAPCFSHLQDRHIPLYSLAVRYELELPQTINGVLAHLVKILQFCSNQSAADLKRNRQNGHLPRKQALLRAIEDGSVDFYKKLTADLLEKFFFL